MRIYFAKLPDGPITTGAVAPPIVSKLSRLRSASRHFLNRDLRRVECAIAEAAGFGRSILAQARYV